MLFRLCFMCLYFRLFCLVLFAFSCFLLCAPLFACRFRVLMFLLLLISQISLFMHSTACAFCLLFFARSGSVLLVALLLINWGRLRNVMNCHHLGFGNAISRDEGVRGFDNCFEPPWRVQEMSSTAIAH